MLYFSDMENLQKVARQKRFCKQYEAYFYIRVRNEKEYWRYKELGLHGKLVVFLKDLDKIPQATDEIVLQIDQMRELSFEGLKKLLERYHLCKILLGQINYLNKWEEGQLLALKEMFPWEKENQTALEQNNKITEDMYEIWMYEQLIDIFEGLVIPFENMDNMTAVEEVKRYLAVSSSYDDFEEFPKHIALINHTLLGYLFERKCVCEGIAKVFYQMCGLLDIPCKVVSGYLHGQGHIWNQVQIDGKWLDVDVTQLHYDGSRR